MATRETVSGLDSHLGYWLRYVSNQVSHAFALKVQALGVTVAEWVVRLGTTRGAISKLADRLCAKGLIIRDAYERDGRAQTLALTPEGRALVPELAARADANDEQFFGDLDPSLRQTIADAMKEIVRRRGLKAVPTD